MGLDVFLYHCTELDKWIKIQREYEEKADAVWNEIRGGREWVYLTDLEKEEAREKSSKIAKSMGLDEGGGFPEIRIEQDSEKYSEHMFKIGYFRSSYNSSGTNQVLKRIGVPNLYDIFVQQTDDEYHRLIDWEDAKDKVRRSIAMLRKINDSVLGEYYAHPIEFPNPDDLKDTMGKLEKKSKAMKRVETAWFEEHIGKDFDYERHPINEREAMAHFVKIIDDHKEHIEKGNGLTDFSSWLGEFHLKGVQIFGLIKGVENNILYGPRPCVYAIIKRDEKYDWYLQALEIVEETIDYALAQDNPDNYYLHWSG